MFVGVSWSFSWSFSWTKCDVKDADLTDDLRQFEPVERIIFDSLKQIVPHNLQTCVK